MMNRINRRIIILGVAKSTLSNITMHILRHCRNVLRIDEAENVRPTKGCDAASSDAAASARRHRCRRLRCSAGTGDGWKLPVILETPVDHC